VEITSNGSKHSFPVEAGTLMIQNDISYVNVDQFDSVYKQLQVSDRGEKVTIRAAKGN
jgi:hypothetical protein